MRGCGVVLAVGLAFAGGAAAQPVDGRWAAEERCAGRATGRTYILTVDGRGLTARLAGANLESFGSILGATVLLPNDTFLIDIPVTGADSKVTYTGRFRGPEGRGSASGGLWEGSRHSACTLAISRMGAQGSGKPTVAGRPEPIPRAGTGGAPATLGPDGVWRREGGAPDISAPAPVPSRRPPPEAPGRIDQAPQSIPVARPTPTPAPAPPAAAPPASSEVEALRRQLEEERRRRAMAESAMRLQEELRRQGGAPPAQ